VSLAGVRMVLSLEAALVQAQARISELEGQIREQRS